MLRSILKISFKKKIRKYRLYIEINLKLLDQEKSLLELIHELLNKSKSETRKLFEGGAISINGEKMFDINFKIDKIEKEF